MTLEDTLMGAKRNYYNQIKVDTDDFEKKLFSRLSERKPKRMLIPVVSGVCLFAMVTVVSAAIEPITWNGWHITIGGQDAVEKVKEKLFPMPDERDWMKQSKSKALHSYSLEQAAKVFPFEISRPTTDVLPLVKTVALEVPTDSFVVWDHFEQGDDWAVSRQMTSTLTSNGGTATFGGDWQPVAVGEGAFAVLSKKPNGLMLLDVYFKNSHQQDIELMIEGNIGEQRLINMAKRYFPYGE